LFDPLKVAPPDMVARIEPLLATNGYTFDGLVRRFDRGEDGSLYYYVESAKAETWSEGIKKMLSERWPGVAFECRYRGYDVTVGLFADGQGTTLVLDHDSVLFYELEKDEDTYREWLSMLLAMVAALAPSIGVFRKGGLKEAIVAATVLDALRSGAMQRLRKPILLIVRGDLLPYEEAVALPIERAKTFSTTSGYTVISTLHWDA
jgi:hypothetical protein